MGVTTGRILAIVFALLFIVSGIVVVGTPAGAVENGDFEYCLINDNNEVEITKYIGLGGDVEIPSIIEGKRVTSIGVASFLGSSGMITSVIIPDSMVTIKEEAFSGCAFLTTLSALTLN